MCYGPKPALQPAHEDQHYICRGCLIEYVEYATEGDVYKPSEYTGNETIFQDVPCPAYSCNKMIKLKEIVKIYPDPERRFLEDNALRRLGKEVKKEAHPNPSLTVFIIPAPAAPGSAPNAPRPIGACCKCGATTKLLAKFPSCKPDCVMAVCEKHQKDAGNEIFKNDSKDTK